MKRRNFIETLSVASFALLANSSYASSLNVMKSNLIKPAALKKGSRIGVIAPATNVSDPDDIRKINEVANYFEFEIVLGKSMLEGKGFKTKDRHLRADDLNSFFKDKSIDGIICVRGGYGSADILDLIDYAAISANPKVFVGYSDITAIHLAIQRLAGIVTFHGPIMLSAFTDYTITNFTKVLFNNQVIGTLSNPNPKYSIRNPYPIRTIVAGKATGKLTGGNLSLVCSLMGTKFEIETDGKILFLEDVDEEPFRIDRMLNQLRLAGKFNNVKGIVFGNCNGCTQKSAPVASDFALGDVLNKYFSELKVPSFYGLMIGHTGDQLTLPYSVEAEIDSASGILNILESGVN